VTQYYKILRDGKSCNGGSLDWPLPTRDGDTWMPGAWVEVTGDPAMCRNGIHVVREPYKQWWQWGCDVYAVETGPIVAEDDDKALTMRCRLLSLIDRPQWLCETEAFVESIKSVPWFKPDGTPDPTWRLFTGSSWAAALAAASDAAWAAARDAALLIRAKICSDLPLAPQHIAHAEARWRVWQKGYALLCDVNGTLYVYAADGHD